MFLPCAAPAQTVGDVGRPAPVASSMVHDTAHRLSVIATNSAEKLEVLRWAGERITRVERMTQISRNTPGISLRFVLLPADATLPPLSAEQNVEDGKVVQRLIMRGMVTRTAADEHLCQLLMLGYMLDHWEGVKADRNKSQWVEQDLPAILPVWMWRGLAGCLEPESRAVSSDRVAAAWRSGQLVPLVPFLRASAGAAPASPLPLPDEPLQSAYATMLMHWLLSMPESDVLLDALCADLAAGDPITPERLADVLPNCPSVIDLEERWDACMLSQARSIHMLGETRRSDVARLEEALRLARGADGIPRKSGFPAHGSLEDLAAHRDARWLPGVVNVKTVQLRMLALGRGEEFREVVEQYCTYLAGLRRSHRRVPDVAALWQSADTARQALARNLTGESAAEASTTNAVPASPHLTPSDG